MPTRIPTFGPMPGRGQSDAVFVANADDAFAKLPAWGVAANDLADQVEANTAAAQRAAAEALASQNAAAAVVNAPKWVAGTWAEGTAAWSPLNGQTYRRKIGMGGASLTDPKNDAATWDPAASVPNNFVLASFIRQNFIGL